MIPVQRDTLLKTLKSKIYTLFQTQDPENHALFRGTYLSKAK